MNHAVPAVPVEAVAALTPSQPQIHYSVRQPPGGAAARRCVVLAHALGCDSTLWDGLADALVADAGPPTRVVCYDHRGHGKSARPAGPYTLDELADDAARVITTAADGLPVVFVGLSMGGMVAQLLALRRPDLVQALVLANTSSAFSPEARVVWDERIAGIRAAGNLEASADGAMSRWFTAGFRVGHADIVAHYRQRVATQDPDCYVATCQAIRDLDLTGRIGAIDVPTLVMAGAQDPGTPVAMAEVIAREIAGAQLVILPDASHLSVIEQPVAFARAVQQFLARP